MRYKKSGCINGGDNEAGVISFLFAVADKLGLLFADCYSSFFEHIIHNFIEVNLAI